MIPLALLCPVKGSAISSRKTERTPGSAWDSESSVGVCSYINMTPSSFHVLRQPQPLKLHSLKEKKESKKGKKTLSGFPSPYLIISDDNVAAPPFHLTVPGHSSNY